jgi:putative ABC transport system substrate-binding protein
MQRNGANAVIVLSDAMSYTWRRQIVALAAERSLPAMSEAREYLEDGRLISYGPNIPELIRRAAALVDKILKGAQTGRAADRAPDEI